MKEDKSVVDKKNDGSRKKVLIGLAIGAIIVCLLATAVILVMFNGASPGSEHVLKLKLTGNGSISDSQLSLTKSVLLFRFNQLGQDVSASTMRDGQGNAFVVVNYSNLSDDKAVSIATTPGVFEMRIQTTGNDSAHVLYGEDVASVSSPKSFAYQSGWGIPIMLTQNGAKQLQQACIQYGATTDPDSHPIIMRLDGVEFNREPLASDLASSISKAPVLQMNIMLGNGTTSQAQAENIYIQMSGGSLPVSLEVVSQGNETN